MFEKLKYKIADIAEKFFLKVERSRERQRQKLIAKRNAYLECRRKEKAQKEREEIKKRDQQAKESSAKSRRTFTTIEEYKKIAGDHCSNLDKLSQHERDVVAKRVQQLCKEDEKFRKDLMFWAKKDYEIPKKMVSQKNNLNQNTITI